MLETIVLSVLNHDSAIASAAARMVSAADGRPLVEMGTRRTHEEAAVAAARSAYLAGFASTSNLAAGRAYGIPTVGTAAHAFVLGHESEAAAFRSQVQTQGTGTTLLVDTFDITEGIRTAVAVAGPDLGAIRIDSGDLAEESRKARALLDELGATGTRIIATSDLDEFLITELRDAPIDAYGVGTRLVTGSGHPTAAMVYKLVAVAEGPEPDASLRSVAKTSVAKVSVGGRKTVHREYADGVLAHETFTLDDSAGNVQVAAIRGGEVVHRPTLAEIREHAAEAVGALPKSVLDVTPGDPYLTVRPRGEQP